MSARKHLENGKDTLLPMMSACFYNCIYLLLILIYTIPHLLSYKPFMGSASHVLAFPKKDFLTECIAFRLLVTIFRKLVTQNSKQTRISSKIHLIGIILFNISMNSLSFTSVLLARQIFLFNSVISFIFTCVVLLISFHKNR